MFWLLGCSLFIEVRGTRVNLLPLARERARVMLPHELSRPLESWLLLLSPLTYKQRLLTMAGSEESSTSAPEAPCA